MKNSNLVTLVALATSFSCTLRPPFSREKNYSLANNIGGVPMGQLLGGEYTIGDENSINAFNQWSPMQRALMIVSADNSMFFATNPMVAKEFPYLKLNKNQVKLNQYYQIFPNDEGVQSQLRLLAQKFTGDLCQEVKIPYHPDTKKQHPVIEQLKNSLENQDPDRGKHAYGDFKAYPSMSRSYFLLNENFKNNSLPLLSAIKVGSDTVYGTSQPDKLLNVHWNAQYVNALSEVTSVHELAQQEGIVIVSDSIGIVYDNSYGVVIRDYSPLVAEQDYFFMPLMAFQEKLFSRNGTNYFWNLYKPEKLAIYDKNKNILRLSLAKDQAEKIIEELSYEMGKLIGIYYLNGISSLDLHGQNLLVGIPLKPELKGMIAVRDISDHWVFPYVKTKYVQLKRGAIPQTDWCQALYKTSSEAAENCMIRSKRLTLKGFNDMAKKLEFKFPEDEYKKISTTSEIYNLLLEPKYNDFFGPQIQAVRTKLKSKIEAKLQTRPLPRIRSCLRSTRCALPHAARLGGT